MVAEPQYNSYIARAQVAEAINVIAGARVAVIEHKATHGRWPTIYELNNIYPVAADAYNRTQYIQEIYNTVDNGTNGKYSISIVFKSQNISSLIAGNELHFSTSANGSGSNWVCEAEIEQVALPSNCIGI
jgi:type IV pilus assembly protein PilA